MSMSYVNAYTKFHNSNCYKLGDLKDSLRKKKICNFKGYNTIYQCLTAMHIPNFIALTATNSEISRILYEK